MLKILLSLSIGALCSNAFAQTRTFTVELAPEEQIILGIFDSKMVIDHDRVVDIFEILDKKIRAAGVDHPNDMMAGLVLYKKVQEMQRADLKARLQKR